MLTTEVRSFIEKAEHRALATEGEDGPNVIPVSATHIIDDSVVLCDFFMGKTAQNALRGMPAALALWKGFEGIQIKGPIAYEREGERYERIGKWAKEKYPDRTLAGIIVLSPQAVYDLTPGNSGKQLL
jgi:predicted pyridoxine 5'-phosphate oxidase superfamily flavin-nucleotide-binding protein